jgi:translation elongation factor EF-Tu-like GTPase
MFRMTVQDVFVIRGRGAVATGLVEYGELRVGDTVKINDGLGVTVDAIEVLRKKADTAQTGDSVGRACSSRCSARAMLPLET